MIFVRIFFVILILGPLVIGALNFYRNRGESVPEKKTHFPALINSAVLYTLAFNLIFFVQELFLVLGKKYLGLTAYLYHNNHIWDGSHPMERLMQGSGALAIFVFGLICLLIFLALRRSASIWKVLLLWLAFNGLIQSVPQVMVAFFDKNTDVGQALVGYLDLSGITLSFLAVSSIILTILVSVFFCRFFLELAPTETAVAHPKARTNFLTYAAAAAALLGCFLIVPFRVPPATQMIAPFLLWLFSIPWLWATAHHTKNIEAVPNEINEKIRWEPIVLLILLLAIFRILLAQGIKF